MRLDGAHAVLCSDARGGCIVPVDFPKLSPKDFSGLDYAKRLKKVLSAFFGFDIAGVAENTVGGFDDDPTAVVKLDDNLFVAELWHGGTRSYKDMSAAVLAGMLEKAELAAGERKNTIVAVSGCTAGASAVNAFCKNGDVEVVSFYGRGASDFDKRALGCAADNEKSFALCADASADEVCAAVSALAADESLKSELDAHNTRLLLGDAHNIVSVIAQTAYYFSAYADLADSGEIEWGDKIDFVMPTGNADNIIAGLYALKSGLPVNKLVLASSCGRAAYDFISTGVYDVNREAATSAASELNDCTTANLERLIFELSGGDAEHTAQRMNELSSVGRYTVSESEAEILHNIFASEPLDDDDIADAARDVFDEYGYLAEPNTAAAYATAMIRECVRPTVVFSTLDPYRAASTVLFALGESKDKGGKMSAETLVKLQDVTAMDISEYVAGVLEAKHDGTTKLGTSEFSAFVGKIAGRRNDKKI